MSTFFSLSDYSMHRKKIFSAEKSPVYFVTRYRLAVRIEISVYDALFEKRLLGRDVVIAAVSKRNNIFIQGSLTCRSRRCCNRNHK